MEPRPSLQRQHLGGCEPHGWAVPRGVRSRKCRFHLLPGARRKFPCRDRSSQRVLLNEDACEAGITCTPIHVPCSDHSWLALEGMFVSGKFRRPRALRVSTSPSSMRTSTINMCKAVVHLHCAVAPAQGLVQAPRCRPRGGRLQQGRASRPTAQAFPTESIFSTRSATLAYGLRLPPVGARR